jgi:O-antigen/teichoic acid export membrane protein
VRPLFARATRRLLCFGVPPVIAAALLGPWLADRLFGVEWAASGTFVLLLVPMFAAQLVVNPLSQTAILMERQGWQLVADLVRTIAVVGSLWLPYRAGWSSSGAIAAYSACMAVTYIGYYILYALILRAGPSGRGDHV